MGEYRGHTVTGFLAYARAKFAQEAEKLGYRIYVTDTLMVIANNIANIAGGNSIRARYIDLVKGNVTVDTRTAEEIVNDVLSKTGLEVIG